MDLDSIIYIVIAIALAVINAVAQKKKKTAQQQKAATSASIDKSIADSEFIAAEEKEDATFLKLQDILKEMGVTDEKEEFSEPVPLVEEPIVEEIQIDDKKQLTFLDSTDKKSEVESIENLEPIDKTEGAIDNAENFLDSIGEYDYNSEENSISSTAIGDALTEEEQATFNKENASTFVKNFSAKDAVIYTEVMKPKYFT
ncbi:MAG TPA: hypothetical protein PL017_09610 [Tenuifilaceae bacterium]|nr:hypothetical protein [Tenuifilaceae bacterium]HPE18865.1 hypothetical protein [Tenuifilaceae bacterium]HPJ46344.1 hypothetical protein [Tenuifilaceae bacterium]HPQ35041.1 hypothetical protein [Tenuifilaceae bacterium]HRX68336.1 hypothetical protein [Tenuifilaceae bacterium]